MNLKWITAEKIRNCDHKNILTILDDLFIFPMNKHKSVKR